MSAERRRADRVFVKLPVTLEGGKGVTRDVNATGVYFESDVNCVPGSEITFSISFDKSPYPMVLNCKAMVVRTEQHDGKVGVAARIIESNFLSSQNRAAAQGASQAQQ